MPPAVSLREENATGETPGPLPHPEVGRPVRLMLSPAGLGVSGSLCGLDSASGVLGSSMWKVAGSEEHLGDSWIQGDDVRDPDCGYRSKLHSLIRFTSKTDLKISLCLMCL